MKSITLPGILLSLALTSNAFAFGAIAVDDYVDAKDPAYGFSINQPSRERAEQVALQYCRRYGTNCKTVVWFETCGAYASSNRYYGYGYGVSKAVATSNALKMCGRNSCKIVSAECENR